MSKFEKLMPKGRLGTVAGVVVALLVVGAVVALASSGKGGATKPTTTAANVAAQGTTTSSSSGTGPAKGTGSKGKSHRKHTVHSKHPVHSKHSSRAKGASSVSSSGPSGSSSSVGSSGSVGGNSSGGGSGPVAPSLVASGRTAAPSSSTKKCAPGGGNGQLVIYGNTPTPQFQPVLDAFAKAYPGIKVTYSDQDDNVAFSKYRAEHAQHARTADIIIESSPLQWNHNKDIALACWTPTDAADYPSYLEQFPGVFILSPDPAVSVYSKALLPANRVPTSFAQLESYLKQYPNLFNKQIATYTVNNQFGYSAFWGLGQQRGGWSVMSALAPASKPQADGTAIISQLASGASTYAFFESGLVRTAFTGALGKLIGWTYMRDFTPLIPRGAAITAGAANPGGAKAFLNWAYSAAGQQVLCTAGFTAFRSGVNCPNSLGSIERSTKNVFLVPFHSTIAQDQAAFSSRWHRLFG